MWNLFRNKCLLFTIGVFNILLLLFYIPKVNQIFLSCKHGQTFQSKHRWPWICHETQVTRNETIKEYFLTTRQYQISQKQNDKIDQLFKSETRRTLGVQCGALIDEQQNKAKTFRKHAHIPIQSDQTHQHQSYMESAKNCSEFITRRGYIDDSLTEEEEEFPIAFSILVFKDVTRVERLLRSIYRPQHYICIHVDMKSQDTFKLELTAITKCFPNVFIAPKSVDVRWGTFTVLEPELICLKSLWKFKKWKYFINLTGQEFPLKTNLELVKILKAYNGANDLEGTVKSANRDRWDKAGSPPHQIRPVKGSVHVVINRAFVDYILHNKTAKDLLDWVKKTGVPDETYFATLNHNPQLGIPGSYIGEPETSSSKPFLARYKQWFSAPCAGKQVRGICIFGIGDLPRLTNAKHLFANKFFPDYQPIAYDCLEEWNFNRTRDYYYGVRQFNDSYYRELNFVKQKVRFTSKKDTEVTSQTSQRLNMTPAN